MSNAPPDKSATGPDPKCCCGHRRDRHVLYVNGGVNAKGSRYVCTADGCRTWMYCDLQMLETPHDQAQNPPLLVRVRPTGKAQVVHLPAAEV